ARLASGHATAGGAAVAARGRAEHFLMLKLMLRLWANTVPTRCAIVRSGVRMRHHQYGGTAMPGRQVVIARLTHHPRRARLHGSGYFRGLGPGLVTGAADDDPSGIGTYSQVGATLRFDLIWTSVLSLPLAIGVIELAARLGLVTDKGLAAIVRGRFAKPFIYPVLWLVAAANTVNIGADLGSMGASLHLILPVPQL